MNHLYAQNKDAPFMFSGETVILLERIHFKFL